MGDGGNLGAVGSQGCFGRVLRGRCERFDGHDVAISAREYVIDLAFKDQFSAIHDGDTVADLFDLAE